MKEDRQTGFTLVEALVALAVLVLALTAFHGTIAAALRSNAASDASETAIGHAHNHIERIGRDLPLQSASGTYIDGLRWQLTVTPIQWAGAAGATGVHWIELVVKNARGAQVVRWRTATIAANRE